MVGLVRTYLRRVLEESGVTEGDLQLGDPSTFSREKSLYYYQREAVIRGAGAVYLFYGRDGGDRDRFLERYFRAGLRDTTPLDLRLREDFDRGDFHLSEGKVPFREVINRATFWMATGSGKTLVIVKIMDVLFKLMDSGAIPRRRVMFLSPREDLIEQFLGHLEEFNGSAGWEGRITPLNLRDFRQGSPQVGKRAVYYYRADLISDRRKDRVVDYRDFENGGEWYIFLDEGHKGDREESRRRWFYTVMSRRGFLFSFSATFTDPLDITTCAYRFNLQDFILEGYGKHLYLSSGGFKGQGEGGKVGSEGVLKSLLLLASLDQVHLGLRNTPLRYNRPLLLALVNTVNRGRRGVIPDLEVFFDQVEAVAEGRVSSALLERAKSGLLEDLSRGKLEFEGKPLPGDLGEVVRSLGVREVVGSVMNAPTFGKVEVAVLPRNRKEMVLRVDSSEVPFALIRIGEIGGWLRGRFRDYKVTERVLEEGREVFQGIERDPSVTMLMGSRAFYEGWDSNRPNVVLFINIGKGVESRKFVLQSIGRGMRVEPLPGKRRRLQELCRNGEVDRETCLGEVDRIWPLETLFVFGTDPRNVKRVAGMIGEESAERILSGLVEVNSDLGGPLLVPTYREEAWVGLDQQGQRGDVGWLSLHPEDVSLLREFLKSLEDRVIVAKFRCPLPVVSSLRELLEGGGIREERGVQRIGDPVGVMNYLIPLLERGTPTVDSFRPLGEELIHFKYLRAGEGVDPEEAARKCLPLRGGTCRAGGLILLGVPNHYYTPVVAPDGDNYMDYPPSPEEVEFMVNLGDWRPQVDWWAFSRLVPGVDRVYIPYPKGSGWGRFTPNFLFWFRKGDKYLVMFLTLPGRELDSNVVKWYRRLFTDRGRLREFRFGGLRVYLDLLSLGQEECPRAGLCVGRLEDMSRRIDEVFRGYPR